MQKNDILQIRWLNIVDSTSDYLKSKLQELPDRFVAAANEQTSGRGQGDHKWHSAPGENLTFSILLKYGSKVFPASGQQLLTMAASLSVVDFLRENGISARIKLPNDIYVGDDKICGMLIENGIRGKNMDWSIVGIGLDVNQSVFPSELPNPVSMKLLVGMNFDIKKCLDDLLRHFFIRFDEIWTGPEILANEYNARIISSQRLQPQDLQP